MSMSIILAILMSIETGGERNPAMAVGDEGKAIGVLQIHKEVVQDVNRRYGTNYVWPADCKNVEKSRDIAEKYLTMYGKGKTPEQLARCWNGGPKGDHSKKTLGYLEKFRRELQRRQAKGKGQT